MNKISRNALLGYVLLLLLCASCSGGPVNTTDIPESNPTVTKIPATSIPTFAPTATLDPEQKYLETLASFGAKWLGGDGGLGSRLSPDGKWVLPDRGATFAASEYQLDTEPFQFISVENPGIKLQTYFETDLLKPASSVDEFNISGPGVKWSPDSTLVAVSGVVSGNNDPRPDMIVLVDISDPKNIKKFITRWENLSVPRLYWSDDSAKLLVWCGPDDGSYFMFADEDDIYDTAWIVDRQGNLLTKFSVAGYRAPTWLGDQIFAIKNKTELMAFNPGNEKFESLFVHDLEISIVGKNESQQRLLLFENGSSLNFLVYDLATQSIVDKVPFDIKIDYPDELAFVLQYGWRLNTPDYSAGATNNNSDFWIFDWQNHKLTYLHFDYGKKEFIDPVGWSPILNGFIVGTRADRIELSVIRP